MLKLSVYTKQASNNAHHCWAPPMSWLLLLVLVLLIAGPVVSDAHQPQEEGPYSSSATSTGAIRRRDLANQDKEPFASRTLLRDEEDGGIGGGDNNSSAAGIINGSPAAAGEFPGYAIPNVRQAGALCGSVLIHDDILMTAAHCRGIWARQQIFIGPMRLYGGFGASETAYGVTELVHPDYFELFEPLFRSTNDIMLVKIARGAAPTTNNVPFVNLNNDTTIPAAMDPLTLVGFGRTNTGDVSNILLTAQTKALGSSECVRRDAVAGGGGAFQRTVMICEDGPNGETAWSGDSGSPVFHADTGAVVGIVSWGSSDPLLYPLGFGAHTRVSAFYDWIQSSICKLSSSPPPDCVFGEMPSTSPTTTPTSAPSDLPTRSPSLMPATTDGSNCNIFTTILQFFLGWTGIDFCG